jgi:hypothetical protein
VYRELKFVAASRSNIVVVEEDEAGFLCPIDDVEEFELDASSSRLSI